MATFTIDLLSGKVFLFSGDFTGSGGTGGSGSTYNEVNTFAELPSAAANNGEIYVVRQSTGAYVLNRNEAGLYFSNGVVWRRLGNIPSFLDGGNFKIYGQSGGSEIGGINFDISAITGGSQTFRTLTVRDTGGTIAYLTDINGKVDVTAFADYTGTTAPATFLAIDDFNIYSGQTLSLINAKQNQLIAGDGINISGDTISVSLPSSIQLKDISGNTEVNVVTGVSITWTTQEYTGSSLNFTGGSRIYIEEDAAYLISYALNIDNVQGTRKNVGCVIRKNGTTDITPMSSAAYSINGANPSFTNSMAPYLVNLVDGDYIELVAFRAGSDSGSALTIPDASWISVVKIIK